MRTAAATGRTGASWSGLTTPVPPAPTDQERAREADRIRRFEAAWRASTRGAALDALSRIQQATQQAHAIAEDLRSAFNRGAEGELDRLHRHARALDARIGEITLARKRLASALRRAGLPGDVGADR